MAGLGDHDILRFAADLSRLVDRSAERTWICGLLRGYEYRPVCGVLVER